METGKATALELVLLPAAAAGLAAAVTAGFPAGVAAAVGAAVAAVLVVGRATRRVEAAFLAQVEAPSADLELAARVGLDPATLVAAKAAVRAAVRQVLVSRSAGLAQVVRGAGTPASVRAGRDSAATAGRVAAAAASAAPAASSAGSLPAGSSPAGASDAGQAGAAAKGVGAEREYDVLE